MKFEDLQRVWREPATGNFKRVRIEDLSAARERAGSYLNHEMRIGMPLLTFLIVVAIPLFASAAIGAPRPLLAWSGTVLLSGWILSITAVWWKLWKARPNPGLPVRDAVYTELERLRTMHRFRSNIRWYLASFVAGEILLFVGLHSDLRESVWRIVGFGAAVLVLAAVARRKNRRDLQGVVRPLIAELESWTVALEETDPEPFQEESR
jgi:hypothetical protein